MNIDLRIDDVSVLPYLRPGTLRLPDAINTRSVLTFILTALVGVLVLSPGQPVTLSEDLESSEDYGLISEAVATSADWGTLAEAVVPATSEDWGTVSSVFSGSIDSVQKTFLDSARTRVQYSVNVADNHAIFDRRFVAESVANSTVGNFITDVLFPEYIEPEGLTLGVVEGFDIDITEAVFSYESLTKVLDKLAAKTGYIWYVNPDKSFHFVQRDAEDATWSITETSDIKALTVTDHREQYRNKQFIKDGTAETSAQTETFVADGQQQTFVVAYPVLYAPTVTVGGVAKTVGIRGLDDGKDFYWNKGKTEISAEAVQAAAAHVAVTYIGQFDVVIEYSDIGQILARKAVEGGTGIYEAVESKSGLSTLDALTDLAFERIRQFGALGKKVTFTTMRAGLQAGQILPVSLPGLDITAEDMLITSITMSEIGLPNTFAFAVTAVTGEAVGGWTKFFRDWLQPSEPINLINQNQILTINKTVAKTWLEPESPNPFYTLYPSAAVFPAADLYPMLHPEQEILYVDVYLDGVAAVRSAVTLYGRVGDVITNRFLLQNDVVGNITHLAFYGSDLATTALGTGTLLELYAYAQAKTRFDIIQIIRTDTKGW